MEEKKELHWYDHRNDFQFQFFVLQLKHQSRIILFDVNMGNKITNLALLQWIGYPYLAVVYMYGIYTTKKIPKFETISNTNYMCCMCLTVSDNIYRVSVTTYKWKDEIKPSVLKTFMYCTIEKTYLWCELLFNSVLRCVTNINEIELFCFIIIVYHTNMWFKCCTFEIPLNGFFFFFCFSLMELILFNSIHMSAYTQFLLVCFNYSSNFFFVES